MFYNIKIVSYYFKSLGEKLAMLLEKEDICSYSLFKYQEVWLQIHISIFIYIGLLEIVGVNIKVPVPGWNFMRITTNKRKLIF
jgi:hypothetical protein